MRIRTRRFTKISRIADFAEQNYRNRRQEERQRFPMEIDAAKIHKLERDLNALNTPAGGEAAADIQPAKERHTFYLKAQRRIHQQLLEDKDILSMEAEKHRRTLLVLKQRLAANPHAIKNLSGFYAMRRRTDRSLTILKRAERVLHGLDERPVELVRRRDHYRRLMQINGIEPTRIEWEIGERCKRILLYPWTEGQQSDMSEIRSDTAELEQPHMRRMNSRMQRTRSIEMPFEEKGHWWDGGRLSAYLAVVERLPELMDAICSGMSVSQALSDPVVLIAARSRNTRVDPIRVSRMAPNRFAAADIEAQRRTMTARLIRIDRVPVRIVAERKE